ncbi:hydrolethalus syndrome protein 1 homolog isoform X2 [Megalops cyprinoides]|uniref:hydrolethalus syndrome protein 1 homolog isoform X2 n=1 Tax=Megalops cyprinoides TaxID=118141 RepID=UPI001864C7F1|nr:hydrolethalus syndrome protein 1 homolog isoform X2 [Megalops cyprinoides]
MDGVDFSEDEIEHHLATLGYMNIPKRRLREFKQDLDQLIQHEKSRSQSSSDCDSLRSQSGGNKGSPPAFRMRITSPTRLVWPKNQVVHSAYVADNLSGVQEQCDSYTQYSVSAKCPQTSAGLHRLEEQINSANVTSSVLDTSKSSGPHSAYTFIGKPVLRRKVLRKQRGQFHVCDESIRNEDSVGRLEDQLEGLHMSVSESEQLELVPLNEEMGSLGNKTSFEAATAFQVYTRGMSRSASENDIQTHPKSFIRPQSCHPHTRNLKKTDPVTKYFQYKQDWETFRAPGETSRKGLRWEIREQMMCKSQPSRQKPQKIYVPNTYVVPTEKKRSALRWEVRNDLANGIQPPKIIYPL